MKPKFLAVIAATALLTGVGLTGCNQETPEPEIVTHLGVSLSSTGHGELTSSAISALVGEEVTLTVTPEEHYALTSLLVNGEEKFADVVNNNLTIVMPEGGIVAKASFSDVTYTVTASVTGEGSVVIPESCTEVTYGTHVEVTIEPSFGYTLGSVKVNGEDQTTAVASNLLPLVVGSNTSIEVTFVALSGADAYNLAKETLVALSDKDLALSEMTVSEVKYSDPETVTNSVVGTYKRFKSEKEGTYTIKDLTTTSQYKDQKDVTKTQVVDGNYRVYTKTTNNKTQAETESLSTSAVKSLETDGALHYLNKNAGVTSKAYDGVYTTFKKDYATNEELEADTENDYVITILDGGFEVTRYYEYSSSFSGKTLYELTSKLIESDGIYNFTFTNTTYAEGNYTKDEGGKVSLSNDAVYKMSTVESYVLNYGTIGEEENREIGDLRSLGVQTFDIKCVDEATSEEIEYSYGSLSGLVITHRYTLTLENILPEGSNLSLDKFNIKAVSGCNATKGYGSTPKFTLIPTEESGSFIISSLNVEIEIYFDASRAELTSLAIQAEKNTVEIGKEVQIAYMFNDDSLNDTPFAFEFEGDDLGCSIYQKPGWTTGYYLKTGTTAGTVKFRAVSGLDSSIKSDWVEVTITEAAKVSAKSLLNGKGFSSDQTNAAIMFTFTSDTEGSYEADSFSSIAPKTGVVYADTSIKNDTIQCMFGDTVSIEDYDENYNEATLYTFGFTINIGTSTTLTIEWFISSACDGEPVYTDTLFVM